MHIGKTYGIDLQSDFNVFVRYMKNTLVKDDNFSDASASKCAAFKSSMPVVIPGQVYGERCTIWTRSASSHVTGGRHSCRCCGCYNGTKGLLHQRLFKVNICLIVSFKHKYKFCIHVGRPTFNLMTSEAFKLHDVAIPYFIVSMTKKTDVRWILFIAAIIRGINFVYVLLDISIIVTPVSTPLF